MATARRAAGCGSSQTCKLLLLRTRGHRHAELRQELLLLPDVVGERPRAAAAAAIAHVPRRVLQAGARTQPLSCTTTNLPSSTVEEHNCKRSGRPVARGSQAEPQALTSSPSLSSMCLRLLRPRPRPGPALAERPRRLPPLPDLDAPTRPLTGLALGTGPPSPPSPCGTSFIAPGPPPPPPSAHAHTVTRSPFGGPRATPPTARLTARETPGLAVSCRLELLCSLTGQRGERKGDGHALRHPLPHGLGEAHLRVARLARRLAGGQALLVERAPLAGQRQAVPVQRLRGSATVHASALRLPPASSAARKTIPGRRGGSGGDGGRRAGRQARRNGGRERRRERGYGASIALCAPFWWPLPGAPGPRARARGPAPRPPPWPARAATSPAPPAPPRCPWRGAARQHRRSLARNSPPRRRWPCDNPGAPPVLRDRAWGARGAGCCGAAPRHGG